MLHELDNDIIPRLRDLTIRVRPMKEKNERDFRRKQRDHDNDTTYVIPEIVLSDRTRVPDD